MLAVISVAMQTIFWTAISWRDIRTRIIPLWPEILFGIAGVAVSIGAGRSVWEIAGGAALGAVICALAYVSREEVGYGDALCVGVIGVWNGISSGIWILMCAMLLLVAAAIPLLLLKKATGKTRMPMAPFLTAGMFLVEVPALWMTL
ncbi:MAG: prepilin peptidase [Lachnospiraceae bacterium]|nr:prepilin peptidase [Lachnospiraceae bacterium]